MRKKSHVLGFLTIVLLFARSVRNWPNSWGTNREIIRNDDFIVQLL